MKKIRILFIQYKLVCGGAEQALFDLVSMMDKSKFEITVLALYGGGEWENKFKEAGIQVVNVLVRRQHNNPTGFLRHQYRKYRILHYLKHNPRGLVNWLFPDGMDIVVSYSNWECDEFSLAEHTKTVRFVHGDISTNEGYWESIKRITDLLPEYDRIVCVSKRAADSFCDMTGVRDSVCVCYNPIKSSNVLSQAQQNVELPDDLPMMCAVGRLAPEKGYCRLVQIHRRILDRGIRHRLVIVGDGTEMQNILRTIEETKTEDTVILAGYQANPYPYMRKSQFVVCSSFTEGLPVIAMEALILGIPLVSSAPSVEEAFGEECCGIITENDDKSLEEGIVSMFCDQVLFEQACQGAKNRSAMFDETYMVQKVEKVFLDLMQEETDR